MPDSTSRHPGPTQAYVVRASVSAIICAGVADDTRTGVAAEVLRWSAGERKEVMSGRRSACPESSGTVTATIGGPDSASGWFETKKLPRREFLPWRAPRRRTELFFLHRLRHVVIFEAIQCLQLPAAASSRFLRIAPKCKKRSVISRDAAKRLRSSERKENY